MTFAELPAVIHVRSSNTGESSRAMTREELRRALQQGALPRSIEVLFVGLTDWTPAHRIAQLWTSPATIDGSLPIARHPVASAPPDRGPLASKRQRATRLGLVRRPLLLLSGALLLLLAALVAYFALLRRVPVATSARPATAASTFEGAIARCHRNTGQLLTLQSAANRLGHRAVGG